MNNAPPFILDPQDPCSPLSVPAGRTALLLLDFHTFIVNSQPPSATSVVETTVSMRKWAKSQGMPVLHCLIDLGVKTAVNRKMAGRANGIQEKMSRGAALETRAEHAAIAATPDEYVFYRPPSHVSALGSYGIEAFLSEHKIESLLLAGFSTSGCVINTAKGAADKGFVVTLLEDACGDKDSDVHEVIVKKLVVGQVHVIGAEDLMGAWKKHDEPSLNLAIRDGPSEVEPNVDRA